ncbi:hypothetical protein FACS189467_1400 [Bacteroidia bacterium]|nr:hypothetical protein FACS189467_1400 [Bacteroidia bacterium]
MLLHVLLSFNPAVDRGWGLNYIRFWETPVILAFYAILVAVLIPAVNQRIVDFFKTIDKTHETPRPDFALS